ncbi:MAG: hypothetical protein Q8942_19695 [Bacillota bacterium]|nr:hypothetical protein [Bacillota bacterium]
MPMIRFAQRITGYFNARVKTLIKIGTMKIIDITSNNSLDTATGRSSN